MPRHLHRQINESLRLRHFWKGRHALVPCTDLLNPGPLKRSASSILALSAIHTVSRRKMPERLKRVRISCLGKPFARAEVHSKHYGPRRAEPWQVGGVDPPWKCCGRRCPTLVSKTSGPSEGPLVELQSLPPLTRCRCVPLPPWGSPRVPQGRALRPASPKP